MQLIIIQEILEVGFSSKHFNADIDHTRLLIRNYIVRNHPKECDACPDLVLNVLQELESIMCFIELAA